MARILIVDDDQSDLILEETILAGAGHEVIAAPDGAQALKQCLDSGVDLVITDLQMPDVHGFELIGILRDLSPSPPVIAVSGTGDFQLDMARQLGAVLTLEKPLDRARLIDAVDAALTD